jgi:hypothetical protein
MSHSYGIPLHANRQVYFNAKAGISKLQIGHLFTLVHSIILCAGRKNITQIRNAAWEAVI